MVLSFVTFPGENIIISKNTILGLFLILISISIIYYGISNSIISFINLGIAGLFIFVILNTLIPKKVIDYSIYEAVLSSNTEFLKKIFENLKLSGNPVYVPPFENLENGGIFVPSHDKFSLNLTAFDENMVFITNPNASNEMGVLINPPIGLGLLKIYEERSEGNIHGLDMNTVFSVVQSALGSMDLPSDIDFEEKNDEIKIKLYKSSELENFGKLYYLSPVISSIFLTISKSKGIPIFIKEFLESEEYMEFTAVELKTAKYHALG
ncbi:hypothetical protein [Methanococcus sp. CF]